MYKDKLFIFIVVLTSLLIIIHTVYNAQSANFYMDDYWWGMYTGYGFREKIFDSFKFDVVHGGGYLGLFLCKLFSFGLPNILGEHPQDFMGVPQGVIRSVLAVFILYLISNIFVKNSKTKPFYYFLFPFCTLYYLYSIYSSNSIWIKYSTITFVNYNWYRYFFSLLFFALFWKFIYDSILSKNKKINYFYLITAIISGYVTGTSSEILFGASILSVILIVLIKFLFKPKINLDINFYIPVSALFISTFLFTTTDKFNGVLTDRLSNNIDFTMIWHFINKYINICFMHEILYWIIFAVISYTAINKAVKYKETNVLIVPYILTFSIAALMFSLILLGSTYSDGRVFWLEHQNIQFLYKMLILIPVLMLFNYITEKNEYNQNIWIYSAIVLFVLFLTLVRFTDGLNILKYRDDDKKLRTQYYVNEKILNYYYLFDEKALLPSFLIAAGLQYYSPVDLGNNCYTDYILSDVYYSKIYKNDKPVNIGYCKTDVKNAIREYYKKGGNFSKEELNKLYFKNLLNEEYVFLKQKNEMNAEEVIKLVE